MASHLVLKRDAIDFLHTEMPEGIADCFFTDPPYDGLNAHLSYGNARSANTTSYVWYKPLTNERFPELPRAAHRVLRDGGFFFCMFDNYSLLELGPLVGDLFRIRNIIVWDKQSIGPGYYFRRQHEMIVFATKGSARLADPSQGDIVGAKRVRGKEKYPTEKPTELIRSCLLAALGEGTGKIVVDPFGGSGATSVAAEELGHNSVYVDVESDALDRVQRRLRDMPGATVYTDLESWLEAVE